MNDEPLPNRDPKVVKTFHFESSSNVLSMLNNIAGIISRLLAKIIGITPDWLIRNGRYWRVPP